MICVECNLSIEKGQRYFIRPSRKRVHENCKEAVKMEVDKSDLEKVYDILLANYEFHVARDTMNSKLHLAKQVRYSPLTSETDTAVHRLNALLGH